MIQILKRPRSDDHECDFWIVKGGAVDMYRCRICHKKHHCGLERCEHLFFNSDYTTVCKLTGRCFQQRHCDTIIDIEKGLTNMQVPMYHPKIKRDQQVKNRTMDHGFISDLITKMEFNQKMSGWWMSQTTGKIISLWGEFVRCAIQKNIYIHRKDRRCFVVAIMFSLHSGICSPAGYVVKQHPEFALYKLNKKKSYGCFKVSDIRYGQKLIMNVFRSHKPVNALDINS